MIVRSKTLNDFTAIKHILEHFPDGVFTLNHQLVITFVNPSFCEIMGYSEQELIGTEITEHLADLNILEACQAELELQGFCRDQETMFKRKDGSIIHISKSVQMLTDQDDQVNIVVSIRDLTQLYKLNKELADSTKKLENYNKKLSDKVLLRTRTLNEKMALLTSYKKALDTAGLVSKYSSKNTMIEVNQALCICSGYSAHELIGKKCSFLWTQESIELIPEIMKIIEQGKSWKGLITIETKSKKLLHLESNIVPIFDENQQIRELVNVSYDVTSLIETTQSLTRRLHYDSLTELPNRVKLLVDSKQALAQPIQLVLLNIDTFNEINSFYGHFIADTLLKRLAEFLADYVQDLPMTVYKLPIDEFAILIDARWSFKQLEEFVQPLLEKVALQDFKINFQKIKLTITAGVASSERVGSNPRDVIVAADMALKLAKRQRKPYVLYDPNLNIKQGYEKNLAWIKRLRSALDEDRLVAFYQPVVKIDTLEVDYYECLARIIEPNNEVIAPYHFLEASKKLKLYPQLTRRMIQKAFERFANETHRFSINLSIEDIADPVMNAWIVQQVRDCSFSSRIIFEIVESEGIQNYDVVNLFIRDVKKHGVKIAIDDFGAGYSNFIYIMRLDVDFIKIDGSIIRNIHLDRPSQVITETIIDFARKLGIKTVAEFVSDPTVYGYVKNLNLDSLQGYLFGEPEAELIELGKGFKL